MKNFFAIISVIAGAGLYLIIAMLYHSIIIGYTLSILWEWFIVPIFNIHIGIIEAIGISLILVYLRIDYKESSADKRAKEKNKEERLKKFLEEIDTEEKNILEEVALFFLFPLFFSALTILIGYILHMFI